MVALMFTNFAFAYLVFETDLPGIGLFKIYKEYDNGYLFFIFEMPVEMDGDDIFFFFWTSKPTEKRMVSLQSNAIIGIM